MTIRTRFAPSPTGAIHVGNLRTALITWLFARHHGGHYLLRIDDTDVERSKDVFTDAIMAGLTWMGINWDGDKVHQRDRMDAYAKVIADLKANGRLYPCYETADELALKRKSLLARSLPPVYDRAALSLTDTQIKAYEAEGRKPHWRFKLNDTPIVWNDLIRGEVKFDGKLLSDPVLIREDGTPLYHLCSVIDDIDFEITHIVRGEDHVTNTATHIQMFEAMGATPPQFAHLPLVSDAEGGKLSKRLGSLSVQELRETEDLEPMAIANVLARLGTADPIEAYDSYEPLITAFDFSKFSRGSPKFDPDEMVRLNAKLLHDMPFAKAQPRLNAMGLTQVDAMFWDTVKPNLERMRDIKDWWNVVNGPITGTAQDADFIGAAATLLPPAPWDATTWKQWTDTVKEKTGRKGKDLFMPLRQALTGMDHGPELATLLPLLGPERTQKRLKG
ncbi:MAG: glutamate--tRNA ligase [Pseudomonadota bacterium]